MLFQACVSAPEAPIPEEQLGAAIAERELRLQALADFSVSGGLSFWDDQQNASASITWTERTRAGADRDIRVSGPLGIGSLRLREQAGIAVVERGGQPVGQGSDGGLLLAQTLGLDTAVPLQAISQWIRGLPGSDATSIKRDNQGRVSELRWQNTDVTGSTRLWRASIRRYREVDGIDLPALVTASSGDGNLRLSLTRWDLALADSKNPADNPSGRLAIPGR